MVKIQLDTYTERMLRKKTKELIKWIPYDVYVRVEQIISEALKQHYIFRCKLEEILNLLQEIESELVAEDKKVSNRKAAFKNSCQIMKNSNDKTVFHNQMNDYEVTRFRAMIMLMLAGKADVDEKSKVNGLIF